MSASQSTESIAAAAARAMARLAHDAAGAIERRDLATATAHAADLMALAVTVQTLVEARASRAAADAGECAHPDAQQRISRDGAGGLTAYCCACRTERPWTVEPDQVESRE